MEKYYMTARWAHLIEESEDQTVDKAFALQMRDLERPTQIAFQKLMDHSNGDPVGLECRCKFRVAWAFLAPNEVTPFSLAPWRVQYFDVNGFIGHENYQDKTRAIEDMLLNYQTMDIGALQRCSKTPQWAQGLVRQEVRDKFKRGEIALQEMFAQLHRLTMLSSQQPSTPNSQSTPA